MIRSNVSSTVKLHLEQSGRIFPLSSIRDDSVSFTGWPDVRPGPAMVIMRVDDRVERWDVILEPLPAVGLRMAIRDAPSTEPDPCP